MKKVINVVRLVTLLLLMLSLAPVAALAQPQVRYIKVADTNTPIPQGTGNFTDFGGFSVGPSFRDGIVAFDASGAAAQHGIYTYDLVNGVLSMVADTNTPIPRGEGNFTAGREGFPFGSPSTSKSALAFRGFGLNNQEGIYAYVEGELYMVVDHNTDAIGEVGDNSLSMFYSFDRPDDLTLPFIVFCVIDNSGQVREYTSNGRGEIKLLANETVSIPQGTGNFTRFAPFSDLSDGTIAVVGFGSSNQQGIYLASRNVIADTKTPIPQGIGNFVEFGSVSLHRGEVAFKGRDARLREGIYSWTNGQLKMVADTNTRIPGGTGNFFNFGFGFTGPSLRYGNVAFLGYDTSQTNVGIYISIGGVLSPLIATGDELDGKIVSRMEMSPEALDSNGLVFIVFFDDGSAGIYLATAP